VKIVVLPPSVVGEWGGRLRSGPATAEGEGTRGEHLHEEVAPAAPDAAAARAFTALMVRVGALAVREVVFLGRDAEVEEPAEADTGDPLVPTSGLPLAACVYNGDASRSGMAAGRGEWALIDDRPRRLFAARFTAAGRDGMPAVVDVIDIERDPARPAPYVYLLVRRPGGVLKGADYAAIETIILATKGVWRSRKPDLERRELVVEPALHVAPRSVAAQARTHAVGSEEESAAPGRGSRAGAPGSPSAPDPTEYLAGSLARALQRHTPTTREPGPGA
jgi:hypothetical protein